jgi:hypothetical protein
VTEVDEALIAAVGLLGEENFEGLGAFTLGVHSVSP